MISLDTETTGVDLHHGAAPFFVTVYDDVLGHPTYWEWEVDPVTRNPKIPRSDVVRIAKLLRNAEPDEDGVAIVLQNAKFDFAALRTIGLWDEVDVDLIWPKVMDTLVAGHLIASNQPHDLTSMAMQGLGIDIQPFEDKLEKIVKEARKIVTAYKKRGEWYTDWRIAAAGLKDDKENEMMPSAGEKTWKLDAWLPKALILAGYKGDTTDWEAVTEEYANADSVATLVLWTNYQRSFIKRNGLWEILKERMKLIPIVYEMEGRGVTINIDRATAQIKSLTKESEERGKACLDLATKYGHELELPKGASPNNSIREFVYEHLKLPERYSSKSKSGNPSLDAATMEYYLTTLEEGSDGLDFIKTLMSKRKRDSAISYLKSYQRFWRKLPLDRGCKVCGGEFYSQMHPCYCAKRQQEYRVLYYNINPTGSGTLRFSSSNPNSQNISRKEDFNLRESFGPAPGREWWCFDFENLELTIPAYESGEQIMIELFEKPNDPPYFGSYHLMNASIIYPELFWPIAEQKGEFKRRYGGTYYSWVKNFGFAVSYGALLSSGTADRAAHKVGAQLLVMNRLKEHSRLNQKYIEFANKYGYVETIPDRTVSTRGYPLLCTRTERGRILETVPLNYHVQGTAMWGTCKAMVRTNDYCKRLTVKDPRGYYIALQVHDEIDFDFPYVPNMGNLPKARKIQQLMQESGKDIGIPLRVTITYHKDNWGKGVSV